ncbi:unannotated protein [freshwater metagenome]|uniref:Unannotated protein n=1 Tax=freshwater metagenome TaxID=449393 RepID=A0A6J6N6L2_9ZZZZ|nr:hypothetical protein [Actinomycetota bacterium]
MDLHQLEKIATTALVLYPPTNQEMKTSPVCTAFFFDIDGKHLESVNSQDVYLALMTLSYGIFPSSAVGIGMVSPGWMGPTGETAPGDHPERKAVELATVLTTSFESASAVRVIENGELLENQESGSGPLVDAMGAALFRCVISTIHSDLDE